MTVAQPISRQRVITEVLSYLEDLRKTASTPQLYSINANIEFFKSTRSILGYLIWSIFKAPKLDCGQLSEINDLLPRYDEQMHKKLIQMEQKKFPGLIEPLVKHLTEYILYQNRPMVLANIGSGGMEAVRQIITRLVKRHCQHRLIFIAIDQSAHAHRLAKENLETIASVTDTFTEPLMTSEMIERMVKEKRKQFSIIYCQNNIFNLDQIFPDNFFDVAFHTLFKHHLNDHQKQCLDLVLGKLSKTVFEYDGFRSFLNFIPQTIVGWSDPVFLNAEIFSNLRFIDKQKLRNIPASKLISLTKSGYYLLQYL